MKVSERNIPRNEEVIIPSSEDIYSMFRPETEEYPQKTFKKRNPDEQEDIHSMRSDITDSDSTKRDDKHAS